MKSFFRFIAGTLTSFSFVFLLLLTTVRFQLLNPQFLISALDKPEVYRQTQRALRMVLKDSLESEFSNQGLDINNLTVGERKILNKQISEITDLITTDKIQDFTEKNIVHVLSYINGQSEKLTLYIPIEKWGFPISPTDEETLTLLNENTDVEKLIETDKKFPVTKQQVRRLHNIQKEIYQAWEMTIIAFLAFLIIRFSLGKKSLKARSLGKLLIMLGGSTLATSAISKIAGENIINNVSRYKHPVQILLGAIATPIVAEIVKLWLFVGAGMIVLGIIIIFVSNKFKKDKNPKVSKTKKSSPTPQDMVPQNSPKTNTSSQSSPDLRPPNSAKEDKLQGKPEQQKTNPLTTKPLAPQPQKE